jgi:predicted nucleic acid-binding protein
MSWLVDTNILVVSANPQSPFFPEVSQATRRLFTRGEDLCVLPQNLIEFWAVATRPLANNGLGLSTAQAQTELTRIKNIFRFLPDTPAIFVEWERLVVQHAVSGKNTHDARIAAALLVHGIPQLLTYNGGDFKRFAGITAIEPKQVK